MGTCRFIKGVHREYTRTWCDDINMRVPVIRPFKEKCKHYNTEDKNGGCVCLDCSQFLSFATVKYDRHLGKSYSDIV